MSQLSTNHVEARQRIKTGTKMKENLGAPK
jgi:hypothetical protein